MIVSRDGPENAKRKTRRDFVEFCQVADKPNRRAFFHHVIADCRLHHRLEFLSLLRARLMDKGDIGKEGARSREDQRTGNSSEHLKPALGF